MLLRSVLLMPNGRPSSLENWSATLQNSQLPIGLLALAVGGFLSLGGANGGTCVNRQEGTDTVQSCDNGSYTVTDRHGRRWVYGTPNAGFDRYPGQGLGGGCVSSQLQLEIVESNFARALRT
jgi:hypothetical protein